MVKARIVGKIPNGFEASLDVPSMEDHARLNLVLRALLGAVYVLLSKCEDEDAKIAIKTRFYAQIMAACEQAIRSCFTASKISANTPKNIVDSLLRSLNKPDKPEEQDTS